MRQIELTTAISFQDYWRATLGLMLLNWRLRILLLGAILCIVAFAYFQISQPFATPPFQLLVVPGALAVAAIVIFLSTKSVFEKKTFLQGSVRYVIDEEGITAIAQGAPPPVLWNAIPKAFELRKDFVVFYSRDRMFTLPKSAFAAMEHVDQFREILKTRLGKNAFVR